MSASSASTELPATTAISAWNKSFAATARLRSSASAASCPAAQISRSLATCAGLAARAASLAVSASSSARTSSNSLTSEPVGTCTKAPWLGRRSTQPSASMRCSASRIGCLLTPSCRARSVSTMC